MDAILDWVRWSAYAIGFLLLAAVGIRLYLRSRTVLDRSRRRILQLRLEAIERGDFSFVEELPMPSDTTAGEREIERAAIERKKRELGL